MYKYGQGRKILEAEDPSFTLEYREDGKVKYTTISSKSSSEAIHKFQDICKSMKRSVTGIKLAAQDTDSEHTDTISESLDDFEDELNYVGIDSEFEDEWNDDTMDRWLWDDPDDLGDEECDDLEYEDELEESVPTLRSRVLDLFTEALEDDPEVSDQSYTSADTSINSSKLPTIYRLVKFPSDSVVLDYGGGRFDNGIEYLATQGCKGYVYDPYNRSSEYNKQTLDAIRANGGADIVLCSNVLNVIDTENARLGVIKALKNYVKSTGKIYITVYEGSKSGQGAATSKGYQMNRKTADYLEEIQTVFPGATRKGSLIIAQ